MTFLFLQLGGGLPAQMVVNPHGVPPAEARDGHPAPLGAVEEWIHRTKRVTDRFGWGIDLRMRDEYFANSMSLDEDGPVSEQDYLRFRSRLWATILPAEGAHFDIRLTTEPRVWMKPAAYTPHRGRSGTDFTLGMFDSMHLGWKNPGGAPFSFSVGRQDLMHGDGWLVMEGSPYDGSWTHYLDSAWFTWESAAARTKVDLIGILQYARNSAWMPIIGDDDRTLTDQDEAGLVLNVGHRGIPWADLDAYLIYKHDRRLDNGMPGDDADLCTLGLRAAGKLGERWKYSVDGVGQFGSKNDPAIRYPVGSAGRRDVRAFGLNAKLSYLLNDPWQTRFHLVYEVLSGDDPATRADEMFDILWGRWPRWSELYNVFSYATETRVGQTANLHRAGAGFSVMPARHLELVGNCYLLFADESVPTRAKAGNERLFSGAGGFRGEFLQGLIRYRLSDHVAAHLWGEIVFPGDFYEQHEPYTFVRTEFQVSW